MSYLEDRKRQRITQMKSTSPCDIAHDAEIMKRKGITLGEHIRENVGPFELSDAEVEDISRSWFQTLVDDKKRTCRLP